MNHPLRRAVFPGLLGMLSLSVMTLLSCAPSGGEPDTEGDSADLPNVVLIISDDHGFTDYGFMGHPTIETPQLDRLASESLVFTRGYVTTALCSPSLATLLTGLYPHQHRITGNDPAEEGTRETVYEAFEAPPHLPAMLAEQGYMSFQSGKYWMGHYSRGGFTHGMTTEGRHGGAGLEIGRSTMQPIYDFIDQAREEKSPFFVWYAPFLPHLPHNPPEELLEKYQSAGGDAAYYAMCEWLDRTCGDLLHYLGSQGLAEETMVVYLADNGWPRPFKGSPYELGVRTPIMIRWPGRLEPSVDRQNLASNIDIVPTILQACGVEPTQEMPGIDLLNRESVQSRHTLYLENFAHDMADLADPAASLRARSCIRGDWKLIAWEENQPDLRTSGRPKPEADLELYNLEAYPLEQQNLAPTHPDRVADLQNLLDAWWSPSP